MKNLHSIVFYALAAPALTMSSGAVLAQQTTGQDDRGEQHSTQAYPNGPQSSEDRRDNDRSERRDQRGNDQSAQRERHSGHNAEDDREKSQDRSNMKNRGYMTSIPSNGTQSKDLVGTDVRTTNDKDVGSVNNLIVDENGQIVAIVVGVGGFLGMGQKDVAIGWDHVTTLTNSGDLDLRVDVTRMDLRSAPEFEKKD